MEKSTWGIHILYSSPAVTTVLSSWRMRRAGNEACKRAMHIQNGTILNIFDDIKVDLKQIWYQDMKQIHGSIQLEVFFCGNNNKFWVLRRQMNDYQEQLHSAWAVGGSVDQLPLDNSNKESVKSFSAVIPVPLWRNFSPLWVASLVHCRSTGSNSDRIESANEFSETIRSYSPTS